MLDVASGTLSKIGGKAPESSLMFAKFSPDGTRVAYVRANNIYVERLDRRPRSCALTQRRIGRRRSTARRTGSTKRNSASATGFRWSPDGTAHRLLAVRLDRRRHLLAHQRHRPTLYPTITQIPYPKVGTTNSAVRIGVVSAEGGKTTVDADAWRSARQLPRAARVASTPARSRSSS